MKIPKYNLTALGFDGDTHTQLTVSGFTIDIELCDMRIKRHRTFLIRIR
jgi:hypothetical protein